MDLYNIFKRCGLSEASLTKAYNCYVILSNLIKYRDPFFIKGVSIETSTFCNRKCPYCPNSFEPTPKLFMNRKVFDRIIDELTGIRFTGFLNYHFYNEPLLDPRLMSWVQVAKRRLPGAFHRIYTNGDYLTAEVVQGFISAGISSFFVTNHSSDRESFNRRMSPIVLQYSPYMHINPLDLHQDHDSRAGLIRTGRSLLRRCTLYNNLQITYTGDVILCCNDYYRRHAYGNIMDRGLVEIWKTPAYSRLRSRIRRGVYDLEICKKCMTAEVSS